jgi:TolB-like protein
LFERLKNPEMGRGGIPDTETGTSFGPYQLDLERRTLSRDGEAVALGGRAFDTLAVLATARGTTVSKEELLGRVWPSRVIEENNLQVQISVLRKSLGDGWIVTIPGRGYRLAPPASWPTVPDRPSLIVLPFQNVGNDPSQEYFVDGLVEDITTALSRIRPLSLIARNSAFAYKGHEVDIREVGRDLGVRYVVQGSVRRAGDRIRITSRLIDAASGIQLWSDRLDGAQADVFDLQDRVTSAIAGTIEPQVQRAEIDRAQRKPTRDMSAYDWFLRGMAIIHAARDVERLERAQEMFGHARSIDAAYGAAYAMEAYAVVVRREEGVLSPDAPEIAAGMKLASHAVAISDIDATPLSCAARALAFLGGSVTIAALAAERACAINPNAAMAWNHAGLMSIMIGDPGAAVPKFERAMQLSPVDPFFHRFLGGVAHAHLMSGRYEEAAAWAERSLSEHPGYSPAMRFRAAAYAHAGHMKAGRQAIEELRRTTPLLRLGNRESWIPPYRRAEDAQRLIDGLRLAGLIA